MAFGMWEAIYAYLSRMVGNRTDTASSTGSLHAKTTNINNAVENGVLIRKPMPSNTLQASSDAEVQQTDGIPTKKKSIRVYYSGVYRISFDLRNDGLSGSYAEACIYKNGSPVGVTRVGSTSTYITFTEDLFFSADDTIELYLYETSSISGRMAYARNFRVYFDYQTTPNATQVLT